MPSTGASVSSTEQTFLAKSPPLHRLHLPHITVLVQQLQLQQICSLMVYEVSVCGEETFCSSSATLGRPGACSRALNRLQLRVPHLLLNLDLVDDALQGLGQVAQAAAVLRVGLPAALQ